MLDNLNMPIHKLLEIIQARCFKNTYFGIPSVMNPLDFWTYQEIIYAMNPDSIVEVGNWAGGTLLALAHMLDNLGGGSNVIGVDIIHQMPPKIRDHPKINLVTGDACVKFDEVKELLAGPRVLVIEDSSHTYDNTLNVIRTYSELTQVGDYFIVEDSICHHGLDVGPNPGPYEAIEAFLVENDNFVSDRSKEHFLITWNPKGYLKRVK